jgi:hypothetical protein
VQSHHGAVGFGEVLKPVTAAVPVVLAVGLLILWLPRRWRVLRGPLAVAVAAGSLLVAQHMARGTLAGRAAEAAYTALLRDRGVTA